MPRNSLPRPASEGYASRASRPADRLLRPCLAGCAPMRAHRSHVRSVTCRLRAPIAKRRAEAMDGDISSSHASQDRGQTHVGQRGIARTAGEDEGAIAWHLPKHGYCGRGQRNPVFLACLHPLRGNGPHLYVPIDLRPSGAAHFARPACGQDRELNGKRRCTTKAPAIAIISWRAQRVHEYYGEFSYALSHFVCPMFCPMRRFGMVLNIFSGPQRTPFFDFPL